MMHPVVLILSVNLEIVKLANVPVHLVLTALRIVECVKVKLMYACSSKKMVDNAAQIPTVQVAIVEETDFVPIGQY